LSSCKAWLIVWRDTPSIRPSSSWHTPAGGGRTIRYRLDQPLIGAVDQRRFGVERLQQSTCNSEFAILRYPVSNTPSNNDAATARKKDQHPLGS
jgi:hypothetical protein